MPSPATLVEPSRHDLMNWFTTASSGGKCHVVTQDGQTYTHLTKLSPTQVKWQVSGFTGQDTELSSTMHFMALLQTWKDFAV
jgi:hypothetical protein